MELTPEQASKAKVLFEYEEAKKALAQRRDDIQIWGKALIATGEALLNHPGTIVLDGATKAVASGPSAGSGQAMGQVASGQKTSGEWQVVSGERKHPDQTHNHHTEEAPPHCNTRYLSADHLATLVTEFREFSQRVIELEKQKAHMGYSN